MQSQSNVVAESFGASLSYNNENYCVLNVCSGIFVASAVGTSMEMGFSSPDDAPTEENNKESAAASPEIRKQSWLAALAVLFTFSSASALVQLLIGLLEAKLNVLLYGSK